MGIAVIWLVAAAVAATQQPISILEPLMVSAAMSVLTILVHATALIAAAYLLRPKFRHGLADVRFSGDVWVTASIALLALAAHFVEIAIWAVALVFCGEFTRFSEAFYHSAMNYTSLGYGDVVMSPSWKLLGPIEAAIGLLMFGVSTAAIFAVMQQLLQAKFANDVSTPASKAVTAAATARGLTTAIHWERNSP